MLNASDITKAVEQAFLSDPLFKEFTVERGEFVNENPAICPWLGIYRKDIDYTPETLGGGSDYWTAIMTLTLVVQATNYSSGAECEDDLEKLVTDVIDKIFSDTTLRNTIDMVNSLKVSYSYVADDEETLFFQSALIDMTLEVSTS